MKIFVAVLAAIFALLLSSADGAISFTLPNSTYGTATTAYNKLELFDGNIYVRFVDSRGRLRESDYILLSFLSFRDTIHFKNSTSADCQKVETPWITPTTWRVWFVFLKSFALRRFDFAVKFLAIR
jgi:hypothetical protein